MDDDPDVTVIVNDDKVEELAAYSDRMWLIDNGEIVIDAPPREFFTYREELAKAYIRTPNVTETAYELRKLGIWNGDLPVTLEEFASGYKKDNYFGSI
jgi:ABC-type phosphate/phosphonate transport system ATPase subunit